MMSSRNDFDDMGDSLLDGSIDDTNTTPYEEIDESTLDHEIEVEEPSDTQSDTQSDARLSCSANEIKQTSPNCVLNTDSEGKLTQNGEMTTKRPRRKRTRHSGNQPNELGEEEKKEDMDVDHKAMLSSADRKIQVGDDFQAQVDETQKIEQEPESSGDEREQVIWRPTENVNQAKLMEFCEDAIGVYKISYDRALYILQKSNFDFKLAREKVRRRRLVTDEWSEDDRTLFKQAFNMFGKRFDKIRQTMPHRSMASIIQFYYNTKKCINYKSLFDSRLADDSDNDAISKLLCRYPSIILCLKADFNSTRLIFFEFNILGIFEMIKSEEENYTV